MQKRADLVALQKSVTWSFRFVSAIMVLALAAYALWFFGVQRQPLAESADKWGQFGDFVGGLLNPLVAYSAFFWLTRSILLQKEELLETRQALQDSASSQAQHAAAAALSLKVAAYTALLNSAVSEVQSLRAQASATLEALHASQSVGARLPNGEWAKPDTVLSFVQQLHSQIDYHSNQRIKYEEALQALLASQRRAASQETPSK